MNELNYKEYLIRDIERNKIALYKAYCNNNELSKEAYDQYNELDTIDLENKSEKELEEIYNNSERAKSL